MLPSGEPAPSGDYVYFISAKTMSGKDFIKSSKLESNVKLEGSFRIIKSLQS